MASTENMPPLPEAVAALKDEGNGFFRAGDFLKAAGAYTKALKVRPVARARASRLSITRFSSRRSAETREARPLRPRSPPVPPLAVPARPQAAGSDASSKPELAPIYSNRSASFLKLNKVSQALADAEACVALRPDWEKAHFRRGVALEEKGDDAGAVAAFEAAAATVTGAGNPEIAKKLRALKKKSKPVPFHVPKTKPPPPAKGPKGAEVRPRGPAGNKAWLATIRAVSEPVHARVAAANAVGGWLAEHLERALKRAPGRTEWFFEDPEVRAFLDAGVFDALLDAMTHTVVSIIQAETDAASGARPAAAAAASGADLAGALAGVLHNLLHPALRAWNARKQHQALLAAIRTGSENDRLAFERRERYRRARRRRDEAVHRAVCQDAQQPGRAFSAHGTRDARARAPAAAARDHAARPQGGRGEEDVANGGPRGERARARAAARTTVTRDNESEPSGGGDGYALAGNNARREAGVGTRPGRAAHGRGRHDPGTRSSA